MSEVDAFMSRLMSNLDGSKDATIETMDKLLAEAADLLNASPKMDAMDLGWKITQFRLARQKSRVVGSPKHG